MVAEVNTSAIALMVLGGLFAIVFIGALVLRHRSKADGPEIPAAIFDPNPPRRFGQRNATVPRPNSAPKIRTDVSRPRRKKSRRCITRTGGGAGRPASARFASLLARRNDRPQIRANRFSTSRNPMTATVAPEIARTLTARRTPPVPTARPSCSRDRGRTNR